MISKHGLPGRFYIFVAAIESNMTFLAVIGIIASVISAFYYLRIVKIIYFDDNKIKFDDVRNFSIKATILLSCLFLSLYFVSPSIIGSLLNGLFI